MCGHIKFCLEEIEAEIDAVDYSVLGARARELLAEHIAGIRGVVDAVQSGPSASRAPPAAPEANPRPAPRAIAVMAKLPAAA